MGGGGQVKFYPYNREVAEKVLALLKGGGCTTSFGVVFTQAPEVLAILKGTTQTKSIL